MTTFGEDEWEGPLFCGKRFSKHHNKANSAASKMKYVKWLKIRDDLKISIFSAIRSSISSSKLSSSSKGKSEYDFSLSLHISFNKLAVLRFGAFRGGQSCGDLIWTLQKNIGKKIRHSRELWQPLIMAYSTRAKSTDCVRNLLRRSEVYEIDIAKTRFTQCGFIILHAL